MVSTLCTKRPFSAQTAWSEGSVNDTVYQQLHVPKKLLTIHTPAVCSCPRGAEEELVTSAQECLRLTHGIVAAHVGHHSCAVTTTACGTADIRISLRWDLQGFLDLPYRGPYSPRPLTL